MDKRLLIWLTILTLIAGGYIYDRMETMIICWQADHVISLHLAPPTLYRQQQPGKKI